MMYLIRCVTAIAMVIAISCGAIAQEKSPSDKSKKDSPRVLVKDGTIIVKLKNGETRMFELEKLLKSELAKGGKAGKWIEAGEKRHKKVIVKRSGKEGDSDKQNEETTWRIQGKEKSGADKDVESRAIVIDDEGEYKVIELKVVTDREKMRLKPHIRVREKKVEKEVGEEAEDEEEEEKHRIRALIQARETASGNQKNSESADGKPQVLHFSELRAKEASKGKEWVQANDFIIGVSCSPAPEPLRAQLRMVKKGGLLVTQVVEGSPADKKLKVHDLILRVNGEIAVSTDDLSEGVQVSGKDDTPVKLVILREGDDQVVKIEPVKRKTGKIFLEGIISGAKPELRGKLRPLIHQDKEGRIVELHLAQPGHGIITKRSGKKTGADVEMADLESQIEELRRQIKKLRSELEGRDD